MPDITPDIVHGLAPTGRLRSTFNLGNTVLAQQDGETGALGGVSVDLAGRTAASRPDLVRRLRLGKDFRP